MIVGDEEGGIVGERVVGDGVGRGVGFWGGIVGDASDGTEVGAYSVVGDEVGAIVG